MLKVLADNRRQVFVGSGVDENEIRKKFLVIRFDSSFIKNLHIDLVVMLLIAP